MAKAKSKPSEEELRNANAELTEEEVNEKYEAVKRQGEVHISELQKMTIAQLQKLADEEGVTDYTGLKKQDLIFKILKNRAKAVELYNRILTEYPESPFVKEAVKRIGELERVPGTSGSTGVRTCDG